jgi:hypothetical protein
MERAQLFMLIMMSSPKPFPACGVLSFVLGGAAWLLLAWMYHGLPSFVKDDNSGHWFAIFTSFTLSLAVCGIIFAVLAWLRQEPYLVLKLLSSLICLALAVCFILMWTVVEYHLIAI